MAKGASLVLAAFEPPPRADCRLVASLPAARDAARGALLPRHQGGRLPPKSVHGDSHDGIRADHDDVAVSNHPRFAFANLFFDTTPSCRCWTRGPVMVYFEPVHSTRACFWDTAGSLDVRGARVRQRSATRHPATRGVFSEFFVFIGVKRVSLVRVSWNRDATKAAWV